MKAWLLWLSKASWHSYSFSRVGYVCTKYHAGPSAFVVCTLNSFHKRIAWVWAASVLFARVCTLPEEHWRGLALWPCLMWATKNCWSVYVTAEVANPIHPTLPYMGSKHTKKGLPAPQTHASQAH